MPNLDKTGPQGNGPTTGRGQGRCRETTTNQPRLHLKNRYRGKTNRTQRPRKPRKRHTSRGIQTTTDIETENNQKNLENKITWLENRKNWIEQEINRLKEKLK
ncbi:DUF5320 domain-containing protein [Methanonatronarchaeum sp. AMET-Sl]|uniref:DUF5320 domain-containing protein n=1 Tax=Methanonatronarchaeum sp. AMET-Sl TaxID=3037654 RepID=UPI00244E0D90|nr:DUF5320 domain-containing protein [Methanonatronarchaeum sp. AMET-Sl]WGI16664.1 DUF5320 domain-containing protein [Methanonatronarchaeum sp. AMET-Sl]